jgi:AmmeMemoRadiSam system protein A
VVVEMTPAPAFDPIGSEARSFLLRLARATIAARLGDRALPAAAPEDPVLLEPRGAFVTLTSGGRLRGCIGHVVGVSPLWMSVRDNALAAAFGDPRFPPLADHELPGVHIEISALSPLVECAPEEVTVGRDGVLVERGAARGLLLPQVAVEHGWDRETFLDHTCRKAGLAAGSWRDPAIVLFRFSAEVFGEDAVSP